MRHRRIALALPWLVAFFAAILLYRSPSSASDLEIVPDSVEYAVTAERLATLGQLNISINHETYPSRYPPGFSALVLAPFYLIRPLGPGAGIVAVLAFGCLGAVAAYRIGCGLAGRAGGVAAALCVVSYKGYSAMARLIMSDVPAVALALLGCALFQRAYRRPTQRDFLFAGLLAALSAAIRAEGVAMLLPFLWLAVRARPALGPNPGTEEVRTLPPYGNRLAQRCVALLAPSLLVFALGATYNRLTFGNWLRDGYKYWCPVPYDYPGLEFSTRYLAPNLRLLFSMHEGRQCLFAMAAGVVGALLLARRHRRRLKPVLIYLALAAVPVSALHCLYFYPAYRFHLLSFSLCMALFGAGVVTLVPRRVRQGVAALVLAVAGVALAAILRPQDRPQTRMPIAQALARETASNAVIATNLDGVFLDPVLLRGTDRRIVPISRDAEYASKCIAPRRIAHPMPMPTSPLDHRSPGLLRGGAEDVFPYTLEENPAAVAALAAGRPIYLDLSSTPPGFSNAAVSQAYRMVPVDTERRIYRLVPRGR